MYKFCIDLLNPLTVYLLLPWAKKTAAFSMSTVRTKFIILKCVTTLLHSTIVRTRVSPHLALDICKASHFSGVMKSDGGFN